MADRCWSQPKQLPLLQLLGFLGTIGCKTPFKYVPIHNEGTVVRGILRFWEILSLLKETSSTELLLTYLFYFSHWKKKKKERHISKIFVHSGLTTGWLFLFWPSACLSWAHNSESGCWQSLDIGIQIRTADIGKYLGSHSFVARAGRGYLKTSVKWQSSSKGCFWICLKNCFLIHVCSIHTKLLGLIDISQHLDCTAFLTEWKPKMKRGKEKDAICLKQCD